MSDTHAADLIARVEAAMWDVLKERHPRQQLDQRRRDAHALARAAIAALPDAEEPQEDDEE